MRPLRVQMAGFSTFKDATEIDFGDTDLVAFVGPTGSGKSSIIDAIAFALYGSVSRYDDARLVAPVISQGANEAKVRLDFELAGRVYVAVRVVRRTKSGASTREARLELADAVGSESAVLASGAKELTEAVERLLGLDFSQFTRTVVLPQGEFAEFLKDDPASRQKLLRRLLDLEIYSRMGSDARREAGAAEQRSEVYQKQIEDNREVTPALLVEHERAATALTGFAAWAADEIETMAETERRLAVLREAVNEIDVNTAALGEVGIPEAVGEEIGQVEQRRQALDTARRELEVAREKHTAARVVAAEAGDLRRLRELAQAADRLESSSDELVQLRTQEEAAETASLAAVAMAREATRRLRDAEQAREAALAGSSAADWVSALEVGQPCPVCRQEVAAIPEHDPGVALVAAESAWAEATKASSAAADDVQTTATELSRLQVRLEERTATQSTIIASLAEAPADITAAITAAEAATGALADAEENVAVAEQSVREVEANIRAAEDREAELRRAFGSQRDLVASLGPPPTTGESLLTDWEALRQWAEARAAALADQRVDIAENGKQAAAQKSAIADRLLQGADAVGLSVDLDQLPSALAQAQAELAGTIERVKSRLADLDTWRSELETLRETHAVSSALGRHLSASGFERWLLSEALDDLVDRATVRLRELSSGQYSLAVDDSVFAVVDHRSADERRDVRTLSGGETFLASLALALALADSIADLAPAGAPRLGSMFLDEGFGTLDTETLDVVATAIEELSAGGRLVGIVTHIEALAERMPVQLVVTKGPSSSTVTRRLR